MPRSPSKIKGESILIQIVSSSEYLGSPNLEIAVYCACPKITNLSTVYQITLVDIRVAEVKTYSHQIHPVGIRNHPL